MLRTTQHEMFATLTNLSFPPLQECKQAGLYYGPHDESLYLCKREWLNHGEDRRRVETNYATTPDRKTLLNPPRWSHLYRHRSTLMMFSDPGSD
ncbi:Hypp2134 [Branchiostoma lanceolatum]|uniref:Hypp2134 protein n=1 Tax=Branchiostoma lanceolatum TaxID=7740 RepID=A0A8J9ZRL4_BRALA|nr:Hypp2134 [Branchiostoma lanceolatum]